VYRGLIVIVVVYYHVCSGDYHNVSEDTHWTPFLNASVNYIRRQYPRPWDLVRYINILCLSYCQRKGKGKGRYSWSGGNTISELRDVTWHMGSHSVTCRPTQVNAPRLTPAMQAGTRFTYPGGMEGW